MGKYNIESPIIIAHRGAGEPENSCLAFQNAMQAGYEGIELDVHKTKDGEYVVHHDKKIKTRLFGPTIEKTNLKQLKTYNINEQYKESITLQEKIKVNDTIETYIKSKSQMSEEVIKKIKNLRKQTFTK